VITLKVRIPAPTSNLLVNLLGVFGLIGFAVSVGGLTHNVWWAVLVASVEVVGIAVVATINLDDVDEESAVSVTTARPRAV
jgi:hypothetical protein